MVTGCATLTSQQIPTGCENSVVYNNVPYADLMGGVMSVAGLETYKYAVLKQGLDPEPFIAAVENITVMLDNPSLTYPGFVAALAQMNEQVMRYAGIEIVFLASLVNSMNQQNMVMDTCDREYFGRQFDNILMMMKMIK